MYKHQEFRLLIFRVDGDLPQHRKMREKTMSIKNITKKSKRKKGHKMLLKHECRPSTTLLYTHINILICIFIEFCTFFRIVDIIFKYIYRIQYYYFHYYYESCMLFAWKVAIPISNSLILPFKPLVHFCSFFWLGTIYNMIKCVRLTKKLVYIRAMWVPFYANHTLAPVLSKHEIDYFIIFTHFYDHTK